jgi:TPR repeat protein
MRLFRSPGARFVTFAAACLALSLACFSTGAVAGKKAMPKSPKTGGSYNYFLNLLQRQEAGDKGTLNGLGDLYYSGQVGRDYAKALEYYLQAAATGVRTRFERIGDMYAQGLGTPVDMAQARHYWSQAAAAYAAAGDANSAYALGRMYLAGKGVARDVDKAREKLEQAAADDHTGAINALGDLYYDGTDAPADPALALNYYLRAVELGSQTRADRIAAIYARGSGVAASPAKAATFGEMAVASLSPKAVRDPGAAYMLARLYRDGTGVAPDLKRSAELFKSAADRGNLAAAQAVGDLYYSGIDGKPDYKSALSYYLTAIQGGQLLRAERAAAMLAQGTGGPVNAAKARELWLRAAEDRQAAGGDASALIFKVGRSFRDSGQPDRAYAYLTQAAAAGNPGAANALGDMFLNGEGVGRDARAALDWYLRAERAGSGARLERIAELYLGKGGVGKDPQLAGQYLQRALQEHYAKAGTDAGSAFALGRLYRDGKGVPRDLGTARHWFEVAAAGGHAGAMDALGDLCFSGQGGGQDRATALRWYLQAEGAGSTARLKRIADIYASGLGVPRDAQLAADYRKRAQASAAPGT